VYSGTLPPEIAPYLRKVAHCGKCRRKRGFEMRPSRDAGGRVENHQFRCSVCNEPMQNSVTLSKSEVEKLLAEGERIKAEQAAARGETEETDDADNSQL
jgi:hypothetical protein